MLLFKKKKYISAHFYSEYAGPFLTSSTNSVAVEESTETQSWYKNDLLHRGNDLPAVICIDGEQEWWINGRCIRRNVYGEE